MPGWRCMGRGCTRFGMSGFSLTSSPHGMRRGRPFRNCPKHRTLRRTAQGAAYVLWRAFVDQPWPARMANRSTCNRHGGMLVSEILPVQAGRVANCHCCDGQSRHFCAKTRSYIGMRVFDSPTLNAWRVAFPWNGSALSLPHGPRPFRAERYVYVSVTSDNMQMDGRLTHGPSVVI